MYLTKTVNKNLFRLPLAGVDVLYDMQEFVKQAYLITNTCIPNLPQNCCVGKCRGGFCKLNYLYRWLAEDLI
jgi:hypothetical protein